MGINSTNRIINPRLAILEQVRQYDAYKYAMKKRKDAWITNNKRKIIKCSKCKRGMRNDIAQMQIDNKRENAPICVPCILEKPRKELKIKY